MWLGQRSGRLGASAQATRQSGNVVFAFVELLQNAADHVRPCVCQEARVRRVVPCGVNPLPLPGIAVKWRRS
eukprot:3984679-Prymnesium_polylepis.1